MFERFTDRARRAVVLSQEAARGLGHNYIGTEHLLHALVAEGQSIAFQTLTEFGVTADMIGACIEEVIGRGASPPSGQIPFTPRAKTVLELSLHESLEIGHNHIGAEHILLGLLREGQGVGCQILVLLGQDLGRIRAAVLERLGAPNRPQPQTAPAYNAIVPDEPVGAPPPGAPATQEAQGSGGLFERFTDRSRRVTVLAQEEARLLNHNYIGTEHFLLAFLNEGEGIAGVALTTLGVSLEAARHRVEEIIGRGMTPPSGHIPFTPRAKKMLELSLHEALRLGHNYIGTEHLLLGLVREGEGVAAQILVMQMGVDLNRLQQQVIGLLQGYVLPEAGGRPPETGGRAPARPGKAMADLVKLAESEAVALGHGYVGSEHLLLALLLVEHDGPGLRDLLDESVSVDGVRELVAGLVGRGTTVPRASPITLESADSLDLAVFEANALGVAEVTPCDLLVPLATAEGSLAQRLLRDLGVPARAADRGREPGAAAAWGRRLDVLTVLAADAQAHGRTGGG